jgi:hypothetical protein
MQDIAAAPGTATGDMPELQYRMMRARGSTVIEAGSVPTKSPSSSKGTSAAAEISTE